jgi:hypothetical protein
MSKMLVKFALPLMIGLAGFLVTSSSFGKTEYTKKEKKACTYCHVAQGKKDLNDVGKCYAEHNHSLEGCDTKK